MTQVAFPLSAIVGQDQLIEALLINAVSSEVGGVLVRGQRGTAKTTAVRALASLLDPAPLVELPLGTTLDRLVGSLDLAGALAGEYRFEPGLLSRADGGLLYVDEVNLLADHLVDSLLDAAATGVVRVEREAVSVTRDARFLLVGTMNVEEGDLRPQLLDRFGLGVEVHTPSDPNVRAEIVRRRLAFERDPEGFAARFSGEEAALAERIAAAREMLPRVALPERELLRITGACARLGVDGVRGDIVSARAARALAALDGAVEVTEDHVRRATALALAHRRRRDPLESQQQGDEQLQQALDIEPEDDPDRDPPSGRGQPPSGGSTRGGQPDVPPQSSAPDAGSGAATPDPEPSTAGALARERTDAPVAAKLPLKALTLPGIGRGPVGRRARGAGRGAGAIDTRVASVGSEDLAVVASLRARLTGAEAAHLREHVRAGREAAFICLVIDASGSMGARRRSARVKGALLEILRDAYARRDRIAVVAFRDNAAEVLIAPGAPLERAAASLAALPTGGRTPLAAGLFAAERLVRREQSRDPQRRSIAVVLTDGRVPDRDGRIRHAATALGRAADAVEIIDIEDGHVRVGLAAELAAAAGGRVHRLVEQAQTQRRAA
jgi:magnesium chelatase subunit D